MPERYAAMILLASWCALRFGELTELRRHDIDLDADKRIGVIRIERAVVRTEDGFAVTTPKSDAGTRDVAVPPHLVPVIQAHLAVHVGPEPDALLFPAHHGGHLAPSTLYRRFYAAREAAGRRGPTVPRSAPLRRRAGGFYGRHDRRADGPAGSLHTSGGDALSARRTRQGSGHRRTDEQDR